MRPLFAGTLLAVFAALGSTAPVRAQSAVTTADIQRLQDSAFDATGDLSRLRSTDAEAARRFQTELDELRDEVVYLRVKLRKGENVSRSEYADVRDRLDDLRYRISSGGSTTQTRSSGNETTTRRVDPPAAASEPASRSASTLIPAGQQLDVRLQDTLSSGTSQVEDRFIATTIVDLQVDGRTVIPAGSELRGVVRAVNSAGRVDRKASLSLTFDQITIDGRSYAIRGTVTDALEGGGYRGDAARIGTGAGVGAIIGGILGGFKGALAGILIGGGGVVAATEGKEVELPAGTVLRVSLDSPPAIR
jgi:hypothetical protein